MQLSYKLLKEYIDIGYGTEELGERLTMRGIEVDGIQEYMTWGLGRGEEGGEGEGGEGGGGKEGGGIVVVEIISMERHPNADKLLYCKVTDGDEEYNIVCGASNMRVGDKVCLARVGTKLVGGLKIKKSKIRGLVSEGMLCSREELGLAELEDGIWILESSCAVGSRVQDYVEELKDVLFDVTPTSNRGDCLSLIGIARELNAFNMPENVNVKYPRIDIEVDSSVNCAQVEIETTSLCKRYTSRILHNVEVKESPQWLKESLIKLGMRPINNIVDITNYVMLEYGQPLHAFDLDKLSNKERIKVGVVKGVEKFVGLDGEERELKEGHLVISDYEKSIALAGVMGGLESGVSEKTSSILLESAYFDKGAVRSSSKDLSIQTESSYRFERGVDIEGVVLALDRSVTLIVESCGRDKVLVSSLVDEYPEVYEEKEIEVKVSYINKRLGSALEGEEIVRCLEQIGFRVSLELGENAFIRCKVPSYREDVSRAIDIVEEVARIYSYDKIGESIPSIKVAMGLKDSVEYEEDKRVKDILEGCGLTEVINYTFLDRGILNKLEYALENVVRVNNPLTKDSEYLRDKLFPNLLNTVLYNVKNKASSLMLYELGHVFKRGWLSSSGDSVEEEYIESKSLGIIFYGLAVSRSVYGAERKYDFYDLKGVLEGFIKKHLGLEFDYKRGGGELEYMHPYRSAKILYKGEELGYIGELHPSLVKRLKLLSPIIYSEIDIERLKLYIAGREYEEISRFPSVPRDLAILVDDFIESNDLIESIKSSSNLLKEVELVDIYEGEQIPEGKKSLSFGLNFQSKEKTLLDETVNEAYDNIIKVLGEKYGGQMREI